MSDDSQVNNKETKATWSENEFKKIKSNEVDGKTNRVSFDGKHKLSEEGLPQ